MRQYCFALLGLLCLSGLSVPRVQAEVPVQDPAKDLGLATFAIVIGSNPGGPGQTELRYAERDAERVADLLQELGRTPRDQVSLLLRPSSADLTRALARAETKLAASRARGQQTRLIFYYSGHARAQALNLGNDQVSISTLRDELLAMPASLTLVMLDACQSGAVSNVKGAEPASDFTHNTMRSLSTEGVAIMASSTSDELSQESSEIQGSYFTHHLVMAMRGAGDRNGDARVSLDEAYRYAYENTLSDTAKTAVGGQHVTLETDLRGQGDIPLSYPVDSSAHLLLPAALGGQLLVQQENAGSVMAELHKVPGSPLSLALPPGNYDATLRDGRGRRFSCPLVLPDGGQTMLDAIACTLIPESNAGLAKGPASDTASAAPHPNEGERLFFEIGITVADNVDDQYIRRLGDFRLGNEDALPVQPMLRVGMLLGQHFGLQLSYRMLESRHYVSDDSYYTGLEAQRSFRFHAHSVSAGGRARLPLYHERLTLAVLAEAGMGLAFSEYTKDDDTHTGLVLLGAVHADVNFRFFGFFVESGYVRAPLIQNLLDDSHNSGGLFLTLGFRIRERVSP